MKKILTLIPRIGMIIVFTLTAVVSLSIGYIVFAPDTWPKPFYLVYDAAGSAEEGQAASSRVPPEGHSVGTEPAGETGALKTSLEIRPGQGVMLDTGSKIVNLMDPTGRK